MSYKDIERGDLSYDREPVHDEDSSPDEVGTEYYKGMDKETRIHRCLLYTSPSPRDGLLSRMPSSA